MANVDNDAYTNSSRMSDSSGTSGLTDSTTASSLTDSVNSATTGSAAPTGSAATTGSADTTDSDNSFLNDTYSNYVALLGMYAEGSRAQSDSFNAKLSKYKCVLFENDTRPEATDLQIMLNSKFPTKDELVPIEGEANGTFKFKSASQIKNEVEMPSTEGEKRALIKEMHAIGASISQPTDNTDRSVFKQRVDGSSDIQSSLNKSGLKIYAATKATVQLVFGYEKTDSGIQASGRMQIVPSTSTPNSSIIVSQFSIKDNKIMGLSKGSSSVAEVMSQVLDAEITTDTDAPKPVAPVTTPVAPPIENMPSSTAIPTGETASVGGRKSKRNKRVKKGKTRKMLKGGKTHRKMKGCKTKSKSRKINL